MMDYLKLTYLICFITIFASVVSTLTCLTLNVMKINFKLVYVSLLHVFSVLILLHYVPTLAPYMVIYMMLTLILIFGYTLNKITKAF